MLDAADVTLRERHRTFLEFYQALIAAAAEQYGHWVAQAKLHIGCAIPTSVLELLPHLTWEIRYLKHIRQAHVRLQGRDGFVILTYTRLSWREFQALVQSVSLKTDAPLPS